MHIKRLLLLSIKSRLLFWIPFSSKISPNPLSISTLQYNMMQMHCVILVHCLWQDYCTSTQKPIVVCCINALNFRLSNVPIARSIVIVFAWKIYAARRDCYWIDFNSVLSFIGCFMTKNLHKLIIFEARYYILVHLSGYIDLWRFFVIKLLLKDKNELKSIK